MGLDRWEGDFATAISEFVRADFRVADFSNIQIAQAVRL
jgi:hypothetical protein